MKYPKLFWLAISLGPAAIGITLWELGRWTLQHLPCH